MIRCYMSFNDKTEQMDWKDEFVWLAIACISGGLLWLVFSWFGRFPDTSQLVVLALTITGFYIISILVRIQNHRGMALTGRTGFPERHLKWIFPIVGFLIGLLLLVL